MTRLFAMVFLISIISGSIQAQVSIEKSSLGLGGSVFFSSQSGDFEGNLLSISPNVDYFFADNVSIGMALSIRRSSSDSFSSWTWGFGPSLRYYFSMEKILPFIGLGYSWGKTDFSGSNDSRTTKAYRANVGFESFLTESVALEPSIRYSYSSQEAPILSGASITTGELNYSELYVGVGLKIFIRKRE